MFLNAHFWNAIFDASTPQIMATSTQIFDPQLSILERARIDPTQPCPVRWRVTGADFDRELIENRMQAL
jgi:hypothetical protein